MEKGSRYPYVVCALVVSALAFPPAPAVVASTKTEAYEGCLAAITVPDWCDPAIDFELVVHGAIMNGSGTDVYAFQLLEDAVWHYDDSHMVVVDSGTVIEEDGFNFGSVHDATYTLNRGPARYRFTYVFGIRSSGHEWYDVAVDVEMVCVADCQGIDDENVLFVNGSRGSLDAHCVRIGEGDPLHFAIRKPSGGGKGKYVIHMNAGFPDESTITPLPANLGSTCFPLPLSDGAAPVANWNSLGKEHRVGDNQYFGESTEVPPRAPVTFHDEPLGDATHLPLGSRWTLQGVILNPNASDEPS